MSVVYHGDEFVLVYDLLWDACDGESHVFESCHGCSQVKVFNVGTHIAGIGRRGGAIDDELGCGGVRSGGADITRKVN